MVHDADVHKIPTLGVLGRMPKRLINSETPSIFLRIYGVFAANRHADKFPR